MPTACIAILFQFLIIRKKTNLLNKQEESVNGTIHDLKTPLNSAITVMSYLAMSIKEQSVQPIISLSTQNLKHLVSNIDSLLIIVRNNRKKLVLKRSNIDIVELMKQIKIELDILYQEKPHLITIRPSGNSSIFTFVDSMYIENVLRNLLENAIKYADNGVKIVISAEQDNHFLRISVSDNGWGISQKNLKKIFDPFFQVNQEHHSQKKGYGIGLTQAKYIVEEHGGKIQVRSEFKKGKSYWLMTI